MPSSPKSWRDPKNIVDDAVREKVIAAVSEYGSLKKAVEAGIWMNKDKGIKINKVRIYATQIKRPLNIRDLWEMLLGLVSQHELHYHWVKGHESNVNNNRCDQQAVLESQKFK